MSNSQVYKIGYIVSKLQYHFAIVSRQVREGTRGGKRRLSVVSNISLNLRLFLNRENALIFSVPLTIVPSASRTICPALLSPQFHFLHLLFHYFKAFLLQPIPYQQSTTILHFLNRQKVREIDRIISV